MRVTWSTIQSAISCSEAMPTLSPLSVCAPSWLCPVETAAANGASRLW
ncbi:unannotated protein [freshwater metagenome]|uniref:Unannotated protein n=1 Tax=freshwater metagenome TaxID=449393 RepID=A0A6J6PQT6_9ZZZZ